MSAPLVLEPAPAAEPDDVGVALRAAFAEVKAALTADRAVVVVVPDSDLLGQGSPAAAAQATALLGMVRALAFEGAREGWRINLVSRGDGAEPGADPESWLPRLGDLTGQLVRVGSTHLGKVWP